VLTFGDSFTFGWGVDIDESWPKVLEKKLRSLGVDVEVLNCGQPSIWSEQYREYVEKAVPLLRPNLVIVGLLQIEDFVQKLGEISVPPNAVSAEAGYSRFHLMGFLKRLPKVAFRNVWALLERKSKPQTTSVHNEWLKLSQEMLLRWKGLKLARYNLVVSDSVKTMFESGNLNP
jgi:hypothetical protein